MEARKLVRTYAKRALRDYTTFLSHFDYTPGLSAEFTEAFLDKVAAMTNVQNTSSSSRSQKLLDIDTHSQNGLSEALVKYERRRNQQNNHSDFPQIPKPPIYKISDLFNAVPPSGLPQYPPDPTNSTRSHPIFNLPDFSEAVTYHPLLTDVLHSLLLSHCLVQTSVKELQRHAYMAARVARCCDGYPIFLAARSPSRADWVEILRKTKNWLGLEQTWEALCTPSTQHDRRRRGSVLNKEHSNGHSKKVNGTSQTLARPRSESDKKELIKQNAIRESLADERVVDEETFRESVRAREARAIAAEDEEMRKEYCNISPSRKNASTATESKTNGNAKSKKDSESSGLKEKDFSISTERAEMIARWIREAPPPGGDGATSGKKKTGKKSGPHARLRKQASDMSTISAVSNGSATTAATGLEQSIESLDMVD